MGTKHRTPSPLSTPTPELVRALLPKFGYSHEMLGEVAGLSHQTVAHLLAGDRCTSTSQRKIRALAARLLNGEEVATPAVALAPPSVDEPAPPEWVHELVAEPTPAADPHPLMDELTPNAHAIVAVLERIAAALETISLRSPYAQASTDAPVGSDPAGARARAVAREVVRRG